MKKIIFLFTIVILFFACAKETSTNTFITYPNNAMNDTAWNTKPVSVGFTDSVSKAINNTIFFSDSFNVATGKTIQFSDSLSISFPAYACTNPNENVAITTGTIRVDLLVLRKKGDFVKYLIPTTSNNNLLESSGSFFLRLSRNGQEVSLLPNASYKLRWNDVNPKSDMKFFIGIPLQNPDSLFTWLSSSLGTVSIWDSTGLSSLGGLSKKGYDINSNSIHWMNSERFIDTLTTNRTRLNVTVPLNYTNKNTMVFAVFNSQNSIVRLAADFSTRSFYALNIPVNSTINLLSISMIENTFYMASRTVTVLNADRFTLTPVKKEINDINALLDNL